ncbi:MAG TPA: DUF4936 family protein [Casimicrobiaceae bacterium]|jgi:hypothetical protein
MRAPPLHCYVYYRIDPARAADARRAIAAIFASLEQRIGLGGRLLQRQDDPLLWMEVYEDIRDPVHFETALADLLAAHRFSRFLGPGSARKAERFVPNVTE